MQARKRREPEKSGLSVKLLSLDEGCERYSFGRATMRRVAQAAGAEIRIGRTYRLNAEKIDCYLDAVSE